MTCREFRFKYGKPSQKVMLVSFSVKNFRSILDLKLDFSFGEGKAPNGHKRQELMPFIEMGKHRLVPCMAFFGANASGKTNILKALIALERLVVNGSVLPNSFEPNLLNPKYTETTLDLEFLLNGEFFNYKVVYDAKEILQESLKKNDELLYDIIRLKAKFSDPIISDTYTQEKLSEILRVECSDGDGKQTKTFLNRIGNSYRGLNSDLKHIFEFFGGSIYYLIDSTKLRLPNVVESLALALGIEEVAALRKITDVVRRLDCDIEAINFIQHEIASDDEPPRAFTKTNTKTGVKYALQISSLHKDIAGRNVSLDFMKNESKGTQMLACLLGGVLLALETGSVLLVDELESSLHPLLLREIVILFKSRRYNKWGAQLIITTHNTDILDDAILRLSEIALVKKTLANGTLVRRLVDAKQEGEEIRNVTNFRKQYLAGYYSGVPHPAL